MQDFGFLGRRFSLEGGEHVCGPIAENRASVQTQVFVHESVVFSFVNQVDNNNNINSEGSGKDRVPALTPTLSKSLAIVQVGRTTPIFSASASSPGIFPPAFNSQPSPSSEAPTDLLQRVGFREVYELSQEAAFCTHTGMFWNRSMAFIRCSNGGTPIGERPLVWSIIC